MLHPSKRFVQGFTLIELLMVIVIIAILASVTIVSFRGIQDRAYNVAVLSDLNNYAQLLQAYNAVNQHYPTTDDELASLKGKASKQSYRLDMPGVNNLAYCVKDAGLPSAKVVIGALSRANKPYYYYNNNGSEAREYTGDLTAAITDICANVMGATPDFTSLGFLQGSGWKAWAG